MLEVIKNLSLINGISGRENKVREYIINEIKAYSDEITVDPLGNLIVLKKGRLRSENKVMLDAHMDEVGLIITAIKPDGTLMFDCVGGINPSVLFGKPVNIGEKSICGVIGVKPIHLIDKSKSLDLPDCDEMYIDIGASDKADAEKYINIGDYACFNSEFEEFGDGFIKGKALDDRAGCAILIDIIKSDLKYDAYFSFSCGEETGSGMSGAAAYTIKPDYAIVVEATTAADIAGVPKEKQVCVLGKGAVISFMDKRTIYNIDLYKKVFEVANIKKIDVQPKTMVAGGNNAGSIHKTAGGIKTIAVSLPCRYIHSPSGVLKIDDIISTRNIIFSMLEELCND